MRRERILPFFLSLSLAFVGEYREAISLIPSRESLRVCTGDISRSLDGEERTEGKEKERTTQRDAGAAAAREGGPVE